MQLKLFVIPLTAVQDSENDYVFAVQNAAGADVDVTTGWDAKFFISSLAQPDKAGPLLTVNTAGMTMGNGQIALTLPPGLVNTVHTGSFGWQLNVSNDAFAADNHNIGSGQIAVVPQFYQ